MVISMETNKTNKILNLIAGIAGIASVAMPTIGSSHFHLVYWMFGFFIEEGKEWPLFGEVKDDQLAMASLTVVAAVLILAGAAMFLLSMIPKLNLSLFTMLGWIIALAGCVVFLIFGFSDLFENGLLMMEGIYPMGIIASFASGGLGLVSWILQISIKK